MKRKAIVPLPERLPSCSAACKLACLFVASYSFSKQSNIAKMHKTRAREGSKGFDGSRLLTRNCQSSREEGLGFMTAGLRLREQLRIRHNMQLNHQHVLGKEACRPEFRELPNS